MRNKLSAKMNSTDKTSLGLNMRASNTIRVSYSLEPDEARHFFGPDLYPNSLQRLSVKI